MNSYESYEAIDSTGTRVVITREVSAHKVDPPEFDGLREICRQLLGAEPILTHRTICK